MPTFGVIAATKAKVGKVKRLISGIKHSPWGALRKLICNIHVPIS